MSFILDALKKSENERQRQTGPALATVPAGARSGQRPAWMTGMMSLMIVVIAVLVVLLLRNEGAPTAEPDIGTRDPVAQSPRQTRTDIEADAARTTGSQPVSKTARTPGREIRPLGNEVPEEAPVQQAAVRVPAVTGNEQATRDQAAATPQPVAQTASGTATTDVSTLPTAHDLVLRGVLQGRPLKLELHVFSDEPARRFVFVNGQKYREGERIGDGPRVAEIVPEGVVMDDGVQRFLLLPD